MPQRPEEEGPGTAPTEAGLANSLVLEIPAVPAYVNTARLFVGAVARHFGIDEGSVDDLKLAVSEACNGAIRVRRAEAEDRPIRIASMKEEASLLIEVEDAVEPQVSPIASTTDDLVRGLGLELIQALFPDVLMVPGSLGSASVRLSLSLATEPAAPELPDA
jgi:serine/threonine-protein kinase RsbW